MKALMHVLIVFALALAFIKCIENYHDKQAAEQRP